MTETWCPFARVERAPYDNGSHGGPINRPVLGNVEHITTNHFDPGGFFANPNSQASSTAWIADDGALVQFLPLEVASWAQSAGNGDYWSVETSGEDGTPMNDAELSTFGRWHAWTQTNGVVAVQFDLNQIAEAPGQPGLGWHGMGGDVWGGHFDCPGDARKAQRPQILAAAQGTPGPSTIRNDYLVVI